jgi:hypothetical protein
MELRVRNLDGTVNHGLVLCCEEILTCSLDLESNLLLCFYRIGLAPELTSTSSTSALKLTTANRLRLTHLLKANDCLWM